MFTEFELETILEHKAILEATIALKKEFIKKEAPFLEVNDHDFFSLIMMSPVVGMALANDSISLFEELSLNKKARKLSKGGYFMKKDPVVYALKFLIKKYNDWEDKFLAVLELALNESFDKKSMERQIDPNLTVSEVEYKKEVLNTPYILIRFISSFFLEHDDDIINKRVMQQKDYERLLHLGHKLGLSNVPVFHMFCKTFTIKK
jgi:hypothetical protein